MARLITTSAPLQSWSQFICQRTNFSTTITAADRVFRTFRNPNEPPTERPRKLEHVVINEFLNNRHLAEARAAKERAHAYIGDTSRLGEGIVDDFELFGGVLVERPPIYLPPVTNAEKIVEAAKSRRMASELELWPDDLKNKVLRKALTLDASQFRPFLKKKKWKSYEKKEKQTPFNRRTGEIVNPGREIPDFNPEEYEYVEEPNHEGWRVTDDDRLDERRSLFRELDRALYLVVKPISPSAKYEWMLPRLIWRDGDSIRETSERALNFCAGPMLHVEWLGVAPIVHVETVFREPVEGIVGQKTFFMRAIYSSGNAEPDDDFHDYAWVTSNQLKDYIDPDIYERVALTIPDVF